MRNLRIFDVSPFMYAGLPKKDALIDGPVVRGPDNYIYSRDIPCGGISFLFNQVYSYFKSDDLIFCCDREPIYKKNLLPGYKGNRVHRPEITKQKQIAEVILKDCGFPVYYMDDYEADDLIYSLVKKHYHDYDHIYVYVGDGDLYLLVDDKVSIEPVRSTDKRVTKENFSYTVDRKRKVPYNTLTFDKILDGDRSDCIPALPANVAMDIRNKYFHPYFYEMLANRDFLEAIFETNYPHLKNQVDIVFPVQLETDDFKYSPDQSRVVDWASAMRHRYFPKRVRTADIELKIEQMVEAGLYKEDKR